MPKGIPNPKPAPGAQPVGNDFANVALTETEDETLARMIAEDEAAKSQPVVSPPVAPAAPKMVRAKLLRNYRPQEALDPTDPAKKRRLAPVFEIVGHLKPAVVVRNVLGKEEILEPEKFIDDEAAPSPKAGVGFADKIWAGTIVRFTAEEARYIRANGIGEIEIDD